MKEDFQGTRVWAEENLSTTWPLLLEAISKTMQRLDVLHSPRTLFSRLSAKDGEDMNSFASRIRNSYYHLSKADRDSDTTRDTLADITKSYLPHVWTLLQPTMVGRLTREGIESLVQIAGRISKWLTHTNLCTSAGPSSQSRLLIADPRLSQQEIFQA